MGRSPRTAAPPRGRALAIGGLLAYIGPRWRAEIYSETIPKRLVITFMRSASLDAIVSALQNASPRRGRPWALPLSRRVTLGVTWLRTNLTVRELAALFAVSRSQAHRVVADIVARLALLLRAMGELFAGRNIGWATIAPHQMTLNR